MLKLIYQSTMAMVLLAVILCGVYPAAVTLFGKLLFSNQVTGSLLYQKGKPVGSQLIGQVFTKPEYFHGRPSAAGSGYDAANSSGSNLGPTNQKFLTSLKSNIETVLKDNPDLKPGIIPNDLVTASASGLDPDLSPEAALVQVQRVSKARKTDSQLIQTLVRKAIHNPQYGIFGEKTVNVLALNLELDRLYPMGR